MIDVLLRKPIQSKADARYIGIFVDIMSKHILNYYITDDIKHDFYKLDQRRKVY